VLAGAVQQLRRATGCRRAIAWTEGPEAAPVVSAADYVGNVPAAPTSTEFTALAALDHATDLRAIGAEPLLTGLADRHECDAATPLLARDGGALAVLLIGVGESDVRPRTLADLDAVAARLAAPFAAAVAMERLLRVDAEIQHLDRLATLGRLAAEIAHEVRNPLVSIKTFLQLLPERRDDPDFFTRFLDVVSDEMRRMERLLDLMIDHARPRAGSGDPAPAPLAEVLASVADLISHRAARSGVTLHTMVDPGLPDAALGEDGLRQLVLNLALNAASATPEGGTVQLRARARDAGIELAIEDQGPGVPEALREAIFEPFFTTRRDRPGGLGLSICRRIVESAGGKITVEDAPGDGARFRVWLPARS
jgi:signal transduction histidine kinase